MTQRARQVRGPDQPGAEPQEEGEETALQGIIFSFYPRVQPSGNSTSFFPCRLCPNS